MKIIITLILFLFFGAVYGQTTSTVKVSPGITVLVPADTIGKYLRPIAGTNITITGTYPYLTFNATAGGSGTLTGLSVATANGFAGTSSGGATPIITITTPISGILKGNGTAMSAATAGTDYGRVDSIRFVNSGLIHTTPAVFALSGNTAVITQTLANQSPYTLLGRASGTGVPSFLTFIDSNYVPSLHSQSYYDARYLGISASPITSVFARTGAVVATSGDYNTGQVAESGNLYFTNTRAIAAPITGYLSGAGTVAATDNILQAFQKINGNQANDAVNISTNATNISGKEPLITSGTSLQYWRGDKTFQTLNTTIVPEGTNLYYTNARGIGSLLTGYTSGAGTVASTDNILQAIQKLNGNNAINANLTGPIVSVNNATSIASQTGTGTTIVVDNAPTLINPNIGNATALSLTLSGNISANAWTTNGIRLKGVPATFTDLTSTGTVPLAYTDVLGGNSIATISATTFTNYVTGFFKDPLVGANVTFTNKYALGAESARFGTSNQVTVSNAGILTATNPVFIAPALGTPSAINLSNATGLAAYLSAKEFGAVGNAKLISDAVVTAASTNLTSATANFTSADVNKTIAIPYSGAGATVGASLVTTISVVNSATSITLSVAPTKSIAGARTITDGAMSNNGTTLTSATANFTSGDIGKRVIIPGAGLLIGNSGGSPQPCYIQSITSSTQVVVTRKSFAAISAQTIIIPGATIIYGTDDVVALQRAMDSASSQKRPLLIDQKYLITATLTPNSNLNIRGTGAGNAIIYPVGSSFSAFTTSGALDQNNTANDVQFADFEIDAIGVTNSSYTVTQKGFYCRFMLRPIFRNLYVHNTGASGIGCDFLRDFIMSNNKLEHCGRQAWEFGGGAGGSGIGLGTGRWTEENGLITGNNASDCGNNGIFTESQSSNILSKGIRIIGNDSRWNGNAGISDRACEGTIIQGNTSEYNQIGIETNAGFVAGLYSKNTSIIGNVARNNINDTWCIYKDGSMSIKNNILGGSGGSGNAAIRISLVAAGVPKDLVISGNEITDNLGRGIWLESGTFRTVRIEGNTCVDNGPSTSTRRPAIVSASTMTRLYVRDNVCYDSKALASKFQSYGLQLTAGTITKLIIQGNDFADNQDGEVDLSGATITSLVYPTNTQLAITAIYTATLTDHLINCTANTFTVTLPTAIGILDKEYIIKNTGAGVITMAGTLAQTFDGVVSPTIAAGASVIYHSNNANFIKIN